MEDEEWEDVLVGSYVPLPITWDENPDSAKLMYLLKNFKVTFNLVGTSKGSVYDEPVPKLIVSMSNHKLMAFVDRKPTEPWIFDRNNKYKQLDDQKLHVEVETEQEGNINQKQQFDSFTKDPHGRYVW